MGPISLLFWSIKFLLQSSYFKCFSSYSSPIQDFDKFSLKTFAPIAVFMPNILLRTKTHKVFYSQNRHKQVKPYDGQ